MILAAPLSRWTRSDFENWDFCSVASHARAILEGCLLFNYLMQPSKNGEELKARINILHLNDCTRRIELFDDLGATEEQRHGLNLQRTELVERLLNNEYFMSLPQALRKSCLNGKFIMLDSRDELLERVGFSKGQFDALFDLWSQHTHILPLSFYRLEANGRGTGLENDVDRAYLGGALAVCAEILKDSTDQIVNAFPDVAMVRQGKKSRFSPGPSPIRSSS